MEPPRDTNEDDWLEIQRTRLEELARKAPILKILASREFFQVYFLSLSQIFFGYYVINSFKSYGAAFIEDDKFLTLIGSVGALCNGVFRIFWSSLLDYFPFRRVNFILLVI